MMWILTFEVNDYDQHGEYFIAAWNQKPSLDQLAKELPPNDNFRRLYDMGVLDDGYTQYHFFEYRPET